MKHHCYNFLMVFIMLWGYLSSENEEEIADTKNSLILVTEGSQLRLPICMAYDKQNNSYTFKKNKKQKEFIFCPSKIDLDYDYKHCLFSDGNNTGPNTCEKRVEPIIIPAETKQKQPVKCLQNRGTMYHFGFKICSWRENKKGLRTGDVNFLPFQIVYSFCYQKLKKQVLQVSHKIYSPTMRRNAFLAPDRRMEYALGTKDFDLFEKHFDKMPAIYKNKLNEPHLGMVLIVPPTNMVFSVLKRAVYHYVNTQLVLKQTASILEHINTFVQNQAIEQLGEIRITDGFERSPEVEDITVWWKIIFSEGEKSAIIIFIHNTTVEPTADQKYCLPNVCEKYGWNGVIPDGMQSFIYCCRPQKILKSLGYKSVRFTLNLKRKWLKFFQSHHRDRCLS